LAAQGGQANVVEFLLDYDARFKTNKENLTFIDLAIKYKQQTVLMAVIAHDRWEEALDLNSVLYKTPFMGIIQMWSDVTQAVMERCVNKIYSYEKSDKKYLVNYKTIS
jgi:hypothetical protein